MEKLEKVNSLIRQLCVLSDMVEALKMDEIDEVQLVIYLETFIPDCMNLLSKILNLEKG